MLFNSLTFAAFFAVVYPLYLLFRGSLGRQNALLLAASCVFYGWWDWRFLALMFYTIAIDYYVSRRIDTEPDETRRQFFVKLSVISNLSVLGFFKYFNFFTDSTIEALQLIGVTASPWTLNIVLPVGISFYTFQSMSYVLDVSRKQLKPADSLLNYAAYVSFFPQLVAGPIERGVHLLPQILQPRRVTTDQVYEGAYLIFWGLFKKIFIADNLARIADPIFASGSPTGAETLLAVYAFTFQIYCDFSAYSDIARGLGKCMGFDIMLNFNLPYFARNPSEFWRRWHISLSSWLRDYLYIGLGGNRGGSLKTYRNLALTMVLGGLWHGAAWNFVIWGIYQGVLLIAHRFVAGALTRAYALLPGPLKTVWTVLCWFVFFQLVCLGWLFFRAPDFATITTMLASLGHIEFTPELLSTVKKIVFYVAPLVCVQILQYWRQDLLVVYHMPLPLRVVAYVGMVVAIMSFGVHDASEFIYFQF